MIGKLVGNVAAVVAVLGWLATAGIADAAKKKGNRPAGGAAVSGMVVRPNGKPVHGARVRAAAAGHHHRHAHVHVKRVGLKGKKKHHHGHAAHVGHHRVSHASTTTGPRGHFTLRNAGSGAITVVAHKRGVGTGRVRTIAGGSNVAIMLHKRHHAHSGVITAHARHVVHRRVAHKKAAGQHGPKKAPAAGTATPGAKAKPQAAKPGT
jgi:hypothetical protein